MKYGPRTICAAIRWHQNQDHLHPLTCGNDSGHSLLTPNYTQNGTVYLECPDCSYVQWNIPLHVVELWHNVMSFGAASMSTPRGTYSIGSSE